MPQNDGMLPVVGVSGPCKKWLISNEACASSSKDEMHSIDKKNLMACMHGLANQETRICWLRFAADIPLPSRGQRSRGDEAASPPLMVEPTAASEKYVSRQSAWRWASGYSCSGEQHPEMQLSKGISAAGAVGCANAWAQLPRE
ncbi:hypothetical protein HaLaN_05387 [Haematococcus lacustris]|uniref:Uncharacterized protein n=1 Tax=Haematococcus lacustris TaxID=44745 RepID=A0A699YIT9_HAELA|nr:hypothetical protein HaLaN_05387 [Haematococcus lacustris]